MNVYFYIETIASITCSVIVTNFFVSVIDSKYKKYVSFIWLFFICNLITLINLYGIKKIGLGVVDGMIFKFVMNTVFFVTTIYFLCNKSIKKTIFYYGYYLFMAYSGEIFGYLFMNYDASDFTIFIMNDRRIIVSVLCNTVASAVSVFYILLYFKIKNKIKNNYMFLILILPLMQVFIFNKYILYLGKTNSINTDILFISTILFTIEILINIIVVNIALKSILAYDLKRKIYLTNLENDKNKYVKDIYMNQKTNFSNLLNGFKNEIKYLLNYSSLVKENQFKDKNVFSKNISNVIKDAEDLNKTIIDLLDKNRDSKNVNGGV